VLAGLYIYFINNKLSRSKIKEIKSKEKQYNKVTFDGDIFANRMLNTLLGSSIVVPVSGAIKGASSVEYNNTRWVPKAMASIVVLGVALLSIISIIIKKKIAEELWFVVRFVYYFLFILGLIPFVYDASMGDNKVTKFTRLKTISIIAGILTTCITVTLLIFSKALKYSNLASPVSIICYIFGGLIFVCSVIIGILSPEGLYSGKLMILNMLLTFSPITIGIISGLFGPMLLACILAITIKIGGTKFMIPVGIILLVISIIIPLVIGSLGIGVGGSNLQNQIMNLDENKKFMAVVGLIILIMASIIIGMFVGGIYGWINGFLLVSILMGIVFKMSK
jgi:hypothetical protein